MPNTELIKDIDVAHSYNSQAKIEHDSVNNPSHYTQGKYECIDVMEDTQGADVVMAFCLGNAWKYLWRAREKNGIEDIRKAQWYLTRYLKFHDQQGGI